MGVLGQKHWSALLAHHGLIVGGRTLEEAVYRAFFFEKAAKMQLLAMGTGLPIQQVDPGLARKARDWRINDGPVKAHFGAWACDALRKPAHADLGFSTKNCL